MKRYSQFPSFKIKYAISTGPLVLKILLIYCSDRLKERLLRNVLHMLVDLREGAIENENILFSYSNRFPLNVNETLTQALLLQIPFEMLEKNTDSKVIIALQQLSQFLVCQKNENINPSANLKIHVESQIRSIIFPISIYGYGKLMLSLENTIKYLNAEIIDRVGDIAIFAERGIHTKRQLLFVEQVLQSIFTAEGC